MTSALAACPACARHVRLSEPSCPFCRYELPPSFRERAPLSPASRLNRAALHALRMGAISIAAAACGGEVSAENDGGSSMTSSGASTSGASASGASASGSSSSGSSTSGSSESGSSGRYGSGSSGSDEDASYVIAPYGGFGVLYGGFMMEPEPDAGGSPDAEAAPDAHVVHVAPPYGGVPTH